MGDNGAHVGAGGARMRPTSAHVPPTGANLRARAPSKAAQASKPSAPTALGAPWERPARPRKRPAPPGEVRGTINSSKRAAAPQCGPGREVRGTIKSGPRGYTGHPFWGFCAKPPRCGAGVIYLFIIYYTTETRPLFKESFKFFAEPQHASGTLECHSTGA